MLFFRFYSWAYIASNNASLSTSISADFCASYGGEKVFYLKSKVRIYAGSLNKSEFVRYNDIVICCVIGIGITETCFLLKDGNVN